jgi:hydroxyacylglutathione hydrolase
VVEAARVDEAVRDLLRVGYDRFEGWFDPADMDAYRRAGGTVASIDEKTVGEAHVMLDTAKPFILDVRRLAEFKEGHIAGATNIAHTRLLARLADIPKDRRLLVHCRSGARSARACSFLQKHGFACTNLAGGIMAWDAAKEPVAR